MLPIHPSMLSDFIENPAINSPNTVNDVELWNPSRPYKRIVIAGSGPSAQALYNADFEDTLLVSNQSSVLPDPEVIVVTDASMHVAAKLTRFEADQTIFAATFVAPCIHREFLNVYNFLHPMNAQGDPGLTGLNKYFEIMAPRLKTFVIQAGCSLNAAVILMHHLLPSLPIYLVGMDFAYASPKFRRIDAYEEPGDIIHDHLGRLTSPQLLSYAGDLKKIVQGISGLEIYAEPFSESLATDFIKEKSINA